MNTYPIRRTVIVQGRIYLIKGVTDDERLAAYLEATCQRLSQKRKGPESLAAPRPPSRRFRA